MSAFRMLARVGNRPPAIPARVPRLRFLVATPESSNPALRPRDCINSLIRLIPHTAAHPPPSLAYSAQLARLSTATYCYATLNPWNLTSVNTDSQPASQPANQPRRATIINYSEAGRLRGKDRCPLVPAVDIMNFSLVSNIRFPPPSVKPPIRLRAFSIRRRVPSGAINPIAHRI